MLINLSLDLAHGRTFWRDVVWSIYLTPPSGKKYLVVLLLFGVGIGFSIFFFCESNSIELSLPENLQQIVVNQFSRVAQHERCSFFGNVTLGSSISLAELRKLYHVVSLWFWICYANGKMFTYMVVSLTIFNYSFMHLSRLSLHMGLKVTEVLVSQEKYVWFMHYLFSWIIMIYCLNTWVQWYFPSSYKWRVIVYLSCDSSALTDSLLHLF